MTPLYSPDGYSIRYGNLIVDLTNETQESLFGGDFGDNKNDVCALRYTVYPALRPNCDSFDHDDHVEDGSYCTSIPDTTEPATVRTLLLLLAQRLHDAATITVAPNGEVRVEIPKRVMEGLSWIGPDWLQEIKSA